MPIFRRLSKMLGNTRTNKDRPQGLSALQNLSISDKSSNHHTKLSNEHEPNNKTPQEAYPPTEERPKEQDMVQVLPDDHPLANAFHVFTQQLMQQNSSQLNLKDPFAPKFMPALNRTGKFLYAPLKPSEIRLIALHPGSGSQDLMCSLTTIPLSAARLNEYEAVSYSWGAPGDMYPVRCNNSDLVKTTEGEALMMFPMESKASIKVSQNLRDALLRLRVEDDFRMLWIDAICINQEDMQERSEQVQLMAEIYERATKVIIWLGEEDEETLRAFECAVKIIEMEPALTTHYPNPDELPIGVSLWNFAKGHPLHISKESWGALCRVFTTRSWFRRVWVTQEVVMAAEAVVVCGGYAMAWGDLMKACNTISTFRMCDYDRALLTIGGSSELQSTDTKDTDLIIQQTLTKGDMRNVRLALEQEHISPDMVTRYRSVFRLESLIANIRSAEATNPRDKIYGLWSMAEDRDWLPQVDYSKSVRQVYIAAAKYWINNSIKVPANLSTFFSCIQMADPRHQLPSWVPDWSTPNAAPALRHCDQFYASGETEAEIRFTSCVPKTGPAFNASEQWFLESRQSQMQSAVEFFPSEEDKIIADDGDCLVAKGVKLFSIEAAERRRTLSHKRAHAEKIKRFCDPYPTTNLSYIEAYRLVMSPQKPDDFKRSANPNCPGLWEYKSSLERQDTSQHPVPGGLQPVSIFSSQLTDISVRSSLISPCRTHLERKKTLTPHCPIFSAA